MPVYHIFRYGGYSTKVRGRNSLYDCALFDVRREENEKIATQGDKEFLACPCLMMYQARSLVHYVPNEWMHFGRLSYQRGFEIP
jgi:hypothetical protein